MRLIIAKGSIEAKSLFVPQEKLYEATDDLGERRMSDLTTETRTRTIARVISYRIAALILTALIVGLKDAVVIHIWLTLLHYGVERIWLAVAWGRVPDKRA